MEKESINTAISRISTFKNAYGETKKRILSVQEEQEIKKFLNTLAECKGMTPKRMLWILESIQQSISDECLNEPFIEI